jgi:hypothetical protein
VFKAGKRKEGGGVKSRAKGEVRRALTLKKKSEFRIRESRDEI